MKTIYLKLAGNADTGNVFATRLGYFTRRQRLRLLRAALHQHHIYASPRIPKLLGTLDGINGNPITHLGLSVLRVQDVKVKQIHAIHVTASFHQIHPSHASLQLFGPGRHQLLHFDHHALHVDERIVQLHLTVQHHLVTDHRHKRTSDRVQIDVHRFALIRIHLQYRLAPCDHLTYQAPLVHAKPIWLLVAQLVEQLARLLVAGRFPAVLRSKVNAHDAARDVVGHALRQIRDDRANGKFLIGFGDHVGCKVQCVVNEAMELFQMGNNACLDVATKENGLNGR